MVRVVRVDCKYRKELTGIAFHEKKRREKLEEFWKDLIGRRARCCGTMPNCLLK